jgi:hypothetical protein
VCKDSRNTTVFGKILENNYMFRPLIEWAIFRVKQENNSENHISSYVIFAVILLFQPDDGPLN